MLLLAWTDDRGSSGHAVVDSFPYKIGRSSAADLRFQGPGVWDDHATIQYDAAQRKYRIVAAPESVLLINGERLAEKVIVPGDKLQIGSVSLNISLSPVSGASLRITEAVFWFVFSALVAVQVLLVAALAKR